MPILSCSSIPQVTCGVHHTVVNCVSEEISKAVERTNVRARLILSGKGDWKYLDIVAHKAGKLAALEYAPPPPPPLLSVTFALVVLLLAHADWLVGHSLHRACQGSLHACLIGCVAVQVRAPEDGLPA